MRRPPQLLSDQGEKVIIAGMAAGLLSLLCLGFALVGAPPSALLVPVPLILLCLAAVHEDLSHVRRHGWSGGGGSDGSNGGGQRDGPPRPFPPGPSGPGEQFDWDAFVTQFWEHVERQPVA